MLQSQDEAECLYDTTARFTTSFDTTDLIVFAFCFIDTESLSSYFQIDLGGTLSQYFGAVVSEKIIENSTTISSTSLFLKDNNEIWPGPVHLNTATGYMAGSFHGNMEHPSLKEIRVQNIKLSDSRTVIYKNKAKISKKSNTIIGNLHYSINKDISLSGIFSVNFKQFAILKTTHGKTMAEVSQKLFQEFLSSIAVNSMSIIRQQVKTIRLGNSLGTPKIGTRGVDSYEYLASTTDASPNNLNNVDNLQQIYMNEDYVVRSYQFFDTEKTAKSSGQFAYKVELSIIDKSQQFVDIKMNNINQYVNQLKEMVYNLSKKKNYDYNTNRLKPTAEIPENLLGIIQN